MEKKTQRKGSKLIYSDTYEAKEFFFINMNALRSSATDGQQQRRGRQGRVRRVARNAAAGKLGAPCGPARVWNHHYHNHCWCLTHFDVVFAYEYVE